MSSSLVESFASDFSPEKFTDNYKDELQKLIDAKLEHGDSVDTAATFGDQPEKDGGGEVLDLMDALRQSIEKNRAKASTPSRPPKAATTRKHA